MSRRGGKQRNKTQIEFDRKRIVELYLKGMNQTEVAHEIGMHQTMVSKELAAVRQRWVITYMKMFSRKVFEELEEVDRLEQQFQEKYEKSKRHGIGNINYLDGVLQCVAKRMKILGMS
jgi:DNA-binding transcriptional regulator LsrR (DeoR family)